MRHARSAILLLASLLQLVSAQRYVQRFNFLPFNSEKIWGIHLRGPANVSYNEWNAQAPLCEGIHHGYLVALQERSPFIGDYIYNVSECILESSSTFQAQTIQASGVLLGLVPILLATTGPSLTELALISSQRPVLAVLFSLGTAAVYPSRTLSFYDDLPRDVINRCGPPTRLLKRFLRSRTRTAHIGVGLLEYLLAMGAVGNTLYTSWQLGISTISVLDCTISWLPLCWSTLPLAIHAIVCGTFHCVSFNRKLERKRERQGRYARDQQLAEQAASNTIAPPQANDPPSLAEADRFGRRHTRAQIMPVGREAQPKTPSSVIARPAQDNSNEADWKPTRIELQIIPSCAKGKINAEILDRYSLLLDLAHKLGTILGFIQSAAGVLIFASVLFISEADAVMILLRFCCLSWYVGLS